MICKVKCFSPKFLLLFIINQKEKHEKLFFLWLRNQIFRFWNVWNVKITKIGSKWGKEEEKKRFSIKVFPKLLFDLICERQDCNPENFWKPEASDEKLTHWFDYRFIDSLIDFSQFFAIFQFFSRCFVWLARKENVVKEEEFCTICVCVWFMAQQGSDFVMCFRFARKLEFDIQKNVNFIQN